jgi:uncharacterized membrane protein
MNLETVSQLVVRHTVSPGEIQKRIDSAQCERAMVGRMFNWIMWGMILLGIGVVMIVVNKTFDVGKWFRLLSTLTMLSGVGISMAGLLKAIRQGVQLSGNRRPVELSGQTETKSLPTNPFPDSLPSVTERTTQLIGRPE